MFSKLTSDPTGEKTGKVPLRGKRGSGAAESAARCSRVRGAPGFDAWCRRSPGRDSAGTESSARHVLRMRSEPESREGPQGSGRGAGRRLAQSARGRRRLDQSSRDLAVPGQGAPSAFGPARKAAFFCLLLAREGAPKRKKVERRTRFSGINQKVASEIMSVIIISAAVFRARSQRPSHKGQRLTMRPGGARVPFGGGRGELFWDNGPTLVGNELTCPK